MAKIDFESMKPVYVQIAEIIEDDIVSGRLGELENCYSQLAIAREMGVNPATAGKGINLLVQKGILTKQRGLSMVVREGARAELVAKHKEDQMMGFLEQLIFEAKKLEVSKDDLVDLVEQHYKED